MGNILHVLASVNTPALPSGGGDGTMVESIMGNIPTLITGLITPIGNVISTNPVCQLALSVGLIGVGIKLFARLVRSFGRLR